MSKKVIGQIRLQLPAGAANPAPPVGPALGAQGVNIMGFCKEFNAKTKDQAGMILPVVITVYADRSFSFILKSPPAAVLFKKAAGYRQGLWCASIARRSAPSHASKLQRLLRSRRRTSTPRTATLQPTSLRARARWGSKSPDKYLNHTEIINYGHPAN